MNPLHLDTPRSTSERTPDDIPADSPTQRVREEGHLPKIVKAESCDLLHVDGDRCVGVCFANDEGFYGVRNPTTKRIAVATGKHGIHYVDWDPDEELRIPNSYSTTLNSELSLEQRFI